ncbi:MAG: glutamine--fructose-6-phosphate transaminase (isomerizing) [Granulosicoccus sp.]|nr:glutamine--fructose-6-phosphate transaminase (isomerizing) [Granulosicoccus sp.]
MCGFIAYTGARACQHILLEGLRSLEHLRYDSAGIAIVHRKKLHRWRVAGTVSMLEQQMPESFAGHCGLAHTRWATHGEPSEENAHPHFDSSNQLALVHNGIIVNADTLRNELDAAGVACDSATDSQVLIELLGIHGSDLADAMRAVLPKVQGTYGIVAVDKSNPQQLLVASNGSRVVIGIGESEYWVASEPSLLHRYTRELIQLNDAEIAQIGPAQVEINRLHMPTTTSLPKSRRKDPDCEKGSYAHFMHREIHDQPQVIRRTLSGRLDTQFSTARLGGLNIQARDLLNFNRIRILGCGSALFAGMAGARIIEQVSAIPADAEPAAEFLYRNPLVERDTLYIAVSQSGETFDTLAAVQEIRRKGGFVLGIVNHVGSAIAREVDGGVYLHAGPEFAVASSKSYSSTLCVFSLLALMLGRLRIISPQDGNSLLKSMQQLPEQIEQVLALEDQIAELAQQLSRYKSIYYFGRHLGYPIALEGAQKLKEISYLHAQAYPASELKHGPIALLGAKTPCVLIAPDDGLLPHTISTLETLKSKAAPVLLVTDCQSETLTSSPTWLLQTPSVRTPLQPMVMGIALQLLAYHCGLALDRSIDQPRHLAKCLTNEFSPQP